MDKLRVRSIQIVLTVATAFLLVASALGHPGSGIHVDAMGQVYFLDTGSGLWKIDVRGAVSHVSPLRNHWLAMDPNNRFTQARLPTDPGHDWVITAAGSNPTMLISTDFPLVMGDDGNLYYPSARESNVRILRITAAGNKSTFVELPRSVTGAALGWVNGLAAGPNGSIYYTEDNAVRRIARQGAVSTIATVTALPNNRTATPGIEERPYLRGLKVGSSGTVYVAESADARVLKISPDGRVTTMIQLDSPWAPTDVAVAGEIIYVLEYLHTPGDDRLEWMPRIRKISPDGSSAIILTVDQMPGARAAKQAGPVSYNFFSAEFFDLLLRSVFPLV